MAAKPGQEAWPKYSSAPQTAEQAARGMDAGLFLLILHLLFLGSELHASHSSLKKPTMYQYFRMQSRVFRSGRSWEMATRMFVPIFCHTHWSGNWPQVVRRLHPSRVFLTSWPIAGPRPPGSGNATSTLPPYFIRARNWNLSMGAFSWDLLDSSSTPGCYFSC